MDLIEPLLIFLGENKAIIAPIVPIIIVSIRIYLKYKAERAEREINKLRGYKRWSAIVSSKYGRRK